ncbi:MAG: alpha/beta hydrolase family protein [Bacteroidota bacterium]
MKRFFYSFLVVTLLPFFTKASTLDTIAVYSKSMHKNIKCVIIQPQKASNETTRYPVIYLLHGYSGSYAQWPGLAPQLQQQADDFKIIFVCPDGGYGSWYVDSPVNDSIRYETFVSKELIEFIDSRYPTIADKPHRAITGLSMGGHGGLYLGIRHKDVYGAAGATSGGVDIRPFPNNWDLKKDLGDTICCKVNWEKNTVINVMDNLKDGELKLIIDCGLDDFFLEVNRNLHKKLMDRKISHDYIERPGAHNGAYWNNSIDYQVLFFHKFFMEKK